MSRRNAKRGLALLAAVSAVSSLGFSSSALAQQYLTWDPSLNGASLGGSGNWSSALTATTNTVWFDGTNHVWWTPSYAGYIAVFGTTAGTVNYNTGGSANDPSVGGLRFDVSGYTISGGNEIPLFGANPQIDTGTNSAAININVTWTGTTTKIGSGTLTFGGTAGNTMSTFNVNDGTVVANKSGTAGAFGGTLNIGDGIGSAGSAVVRLTGTNVTQFKSYGATTINSDGLLDLGGTAQSDPNASFVLNGGGQIVGNGGSLTSLTSIRLYGGSTVSGGSSTISINIIGKPSAGDHIDVNDGSTFNTGGGSITLDYQSGTFGNTIGSNGGTIQTGAGTISFLGNNTNTACGVIYTNGGALLSGLTISGNIALGGASVSGTNAGANCFRLLNIAHNPYLSGADTTISAVISDGVGVTSNGLTKTGAGVVALTGTNVFTGNVNIQQGALRADEGVGMPTTANIIFNGANGGTWETNGTLNLTLGTGPGNVQWSATGLGGFSAYGGPLTVNLNSSAPLVLNSTPLFGNTAGNLIFGSTDSNDHLTFQNSIDLNPTNGGATSGLTRTFTVIDNPYTTNDVTELSGIISSTAGGTLTKAGNGVLYLSNNANSFSNYLVLAGGTLRVTANAASIPTTVNLDFKNATVVSSSILETSGSFTRTYGSGAGQVQFDTSNNYAAVGFSARGGNLTINMGGAGAVINPFQSKALYMVLGAPTSDSTVIWQNGLNLSVGPNGGLTTRILQVNRGIGTTPEAEIDGVISQTAAANFAKTGAGTVVLTGSNTYTGFTGVRDGTLLVGGNVAAGTASPLGNATSPVLLGDTIAPLTFTTVRVATAASPGGTFVTTNPTSGELQFTSVPTVDGVVLATGDRVLVDNDSTASRNGIYAVTSANSAGQTWDRVADLSTSAGFMYGVQVDVTAGLTNAGTRWCVIDSGNVTLNTTNMDWQSQNPTPAPSLLTNGAYTMGRDIIVTNNNSTGASTLGGNTADSSVFSGNVTLQKNVSLTAALGGTVNFTGAISDGGATLGVTTTGAGTVVLSASNAYSGGTTAASGTLQIGNVNALGTGPLAIGNGSVALAAGLSGTPASSAVVLSGLSFSGTGTLDVSNNAMVLKGGGSAGEAAIEGELKAGQIFSSQPVNTLYAVGAMVNNNLAGGAYYSTFAGVGALASTDVLVMYTWAGDANLDGKIDQTDYAMIDVGFASGGVKTGWMWGDFNHDGVVNALDYALIDAAASGQNVVLAGQMEALHTAEFGAVYTQALSADLGAAVPEPSIIGLLGLGGAGMLLRRRRSMR